MFLMKITSHISYILHNLGQISSKKTKTVKKKSVLNLIDLHVL